MRINFGCGNKILQGWTNIDAVARAGISPQVIYAARFDGPRLVSQVPLPDECADELMALHVIEHFYAWEAPVILAEWRRLLKSGGRLILELPNIECAARNLLAGMDDQMCMWPFYGDPSHVDPYMCHRWGYTPRTIRQLVAGAGFSDIQIKPPQTHKRRANRDMRVEAIK